MLVHGTFTAHPGHPIQIVFSPQQDQKPKGPPFPGLGDASQQSQPEEQEPEVALKPYQFLMVNVLR